MSDYKSLWVKTMALLEMKSEFRIEILDSLHPEVKSGFDTITRISLEELESKFEADKEIFDKMKNTIEMLLAFSVWGGYMVFMVENSKDPVKSRLHEKEATQKVGELWMSEYQKDQGRSLLMSIDPMISMFIEKLKQGRFNQLLLVHPEIVHQSHKKVSHLDSHLTWAGYQGYVLALLENSLIGEDNE